MIHVYTAIAFGMGAHVKADNSQFSTNFSGYTVLVMQLCCVLPSPRSMVTPGHRVYLEYVHAVLYP